jgi:uncharacterized protein
MIKAVYDTNVVVSAHLKKESWPTIVLNLALHKKVKLFVSKEILKEYQGVLLRKKFGLSSAKVRKSINLVKQRAKLIEPDISLYVSEDKSDNKFLECAVKAKIDFLVTGNKKHFPKQSFKGIKIVSPVEFINYFLKDLLNN